MPNKLLNFVNWRMKVQIQDTRIMLGTLLAFDKHMNICLGDTEEYRKVPGASKSELVEEKRALGLVLLRGEHVHSMTIDAPPAAKPRAILVNGQIKIIGVGKGSTLSATGTPSAAAVAAAAKDVAPGVSAAASVTSAPAIMPRDPNAPTLPPMLSGRLPPCPIPPPPTPGVPCLMPSTAPPLPTALPPLPGLPAPGMGGMAGMMGMGLPGMPPMGMMGMPGMPGMAMPPQ